MVAVFTEPSAEFHTPSTPPPRVSSVAQTFNPLNLEFNVSTSRLAPHPQAPEGLSQDVRGIQSP